MDAPALNVLIYRFLHQDAGYEEAAAEIAADGCAAAALLLVLNDYLVEFNGEGFADYIGIITDEALAMHHMISQAAIENEGLDASVIRNLNQKQIKEGAAFFVDLQKGISQAAAGELHDRGSFAPYLESDEHDEKVAEEERILSDLFGDSDEEANEPLRRAAQRLREQKEESTDDVLARIWSGIPDSEAPTTNKLYGPYSYAQVMAARRARVKPLEPEAQAWLDAGGDMFFTTENLNGLAAPPTSSYDDEPTDVLVDTLEGMWERHEPLHPEMVWVLANRLLKAEETLGSIRTVVGEIINDIYKPAPKVDVQASVDAGNAYLEAMGIPLPDPNGND